MTIDGWAVFWVLVALVLVLGSGLMGIQNRLASIVGRLDRIIEQHDKDVARTDGRMAEPRTVHEGSSKDETFDGSMFG